MIELTHNPIDSAAVLELLERGDDLSAKHAFLAPTLLRSEVLDGLLQLVRRGNVGEQDARSRLAQFATMKIRYLGDKMLRRRAWDLTIEHGWESTRDAEYVALTQLQADALIAGNAQLAERARHLVELSNL